MKIRIKNFSRKYTSMFIHTRVITTREAYLVMKQAYVDMKVKVDRGKCKIRPIKFLEKYWIKNRTSEIRTNYTVWIYLLREFNEEHKGLNKGMQAN